MATTLGQRLRLRLVAATTLVVRLPLLVVAMSLSCPDGASPIAWPHTEAETEAERRGEASSVRPTEGLGQKSADGGRPNKAGLERGCDPLTARTRMAYVRVSIPKYCAPCASHCRDPGAWPPGSTWFDLSGFVGSIPELQNLTAVALRALRRAHVCASRLGHSRASAESYQRSNGAAPRALANDFQST